MKKMFDSHAHYYDERFGESAHALLDSLFADSVGYIVNVGTCPENAAKVLDMAAQFEGMYAAVGIHPTDGQYLVDKQAALAAIYDMIRDPAARRQQKIVALGEIGLDYHYPDTDKAVQARIFEAQLEMASELSLPVIIHDREAHGDCHAAILAHPQVTGVFHSFSGSAEMARDLVRRGWYISFSGVVTFKNAPRVREAVAAVPLDRLLIETDCPYLAPHPHRGKLNHSGLMSHTAAAVADVLGLDVDDVIAATAENAKRLFEIQ